MAEPLTRCLAYMAPSVMRNPAWPFGVVVCKGEKGHTHDHYGRGVTWKGPDVLPLLRDVLREAIDAREYRFDPTPEQTTRWLEQARGWVQVLEDDR